MFPSIHILPTSSSCSVQETLDSQVPWASNRQGPKGSTIESNCDVIRFFSWLIYAHNGNRISNDIFSNSYVHDTVNAMIVPNSKAIVQRFSQQIWQDW